MMDFVFFYFDRFEEENGSYTNANYLKLPPFRYEDIKKTVSHLVEYKEDSC